LDLFATLHLATLFLIKTDKDGSEIIHKDPLNSNFEQTQRCRQWRNNGGSGTRAAPS